MPQSLDAIQRNQRPSRGGVRITPPGKFGRKVYNYCNHQGGERITRDLVTCSTHSRRRTPPTRSHSSATHQPPRSPFGSENPSGSQHSFLTSPKSQMGRRRTSIWLTAHRERASTIPSFGGGISCASHEAQETLFWRLYVQFCENFHGTWEDSPGAEHTKKKSS